MLGKREESISRKNDQPELSIGLGLAIFAFYYKIDSSEVTLAYE